MGKAASKTVPITPATPVVRETLLQTYAKHGILPTPAAYGEPGAATKQLLDRLFLTHEVEVGEVGEGKESKEADENVKMCVSAEELKTAARQVFTAMIVKCLNGGMNFETSEKIDILVDSFALDHQGQSRAEIEKSIPIYVKVIWYYLTNQWFGPSNEKRFVDKHLKNSKFWVIKYMNENVFTSTQQRGK